MGIPEILYIVLLSLNMGLSIALHGQRKNDTHNAWGTLLGTVVVVSLLYWGGFFA